ncbi:MAG: hypothetical protein ACHQT8_02480 [Chlamydiales bacterium]
MTSAITPSVSQGTGAPALPIRETRLSPFVDGSRPIIPLSHRDSFLQIPIAPAKTPMAPPLEEGVAYGLPGRGPRPPPGCCSRIAHTFCRLIAGLFRMCVHCLVVCIVRCIRYCIPPQTQEEINSQDVPQFRPRVRLNPEAQAVADFVLAAEAGDSSFNFVEEYGRFSQAIRDHVLREFRFSYYEKIYRKEIDRAIEKYRHEERKGEPPSDAILQERVIEGFVANHPVSEFIVNNLTHPVIIEILERILPRGWR